MVIIEEALHKWSQSTCISLILYNNPFILQIICICYFGYEVALFLVTEFRHMQQHHVRRLFWMKHFTNSAKLLQWVLYYMLTHLFRKKYVFAILVMKLFYFWSPNLGTCNNTMYEGHYERNTLQMEPINFTGNYITY